MSLHIISHFVICRNSYKESVCTFIKLEVGVAKMSHFSELHFTLSKVFARFTIEKSSHLRLPLCTQHRRLLSLVVELEREIISSIRYHYTYIHRTESWKQTSVFTGIPHRHWLDFYISASHSFTIQLYTPFPQPTLGPLHTLCTMRIMWVVLILLYECVCVVIISVACQAPANVPPTSPQNPHWKSYSKNFINPQRWIFAKRERWYTFCIFCYSVKWMLNGVLNNLSQSWRCTNPAQ